MTINESNWHHGITGQNVDEGSKGFACVSLEAYLSDELLIAVRASPVTMLTIEGAETLIACLQYIVGKSKEMEEVIQNTSLDENGDRLTPLRDLAAVFKQ